MKLTLPAKIAAGACALIVMGCASGGGGNDDSASVSGKSGGKGDSGSSSSGAGDVGNWDILNKPEFKGEFGIFATTDLVVRNASDGEDEPWLEIRLTNKKNDLVATYDCIGDTIEPGQKTTLDCTSLDDFAPFTDYEIKDAF